jgi:hypothetical protein
MRLPRRIAFLLIVATSISTGQTQLQFRDSLVDFDYPVGWRAQRSVGQRAVSINLTPPGIVNRDFYIGVETVAGYISGKDAHEQKVESFRKRNPDWSKIGTPTIQELPGGQGLTTQLRDRTGDTQIVTTILTSGVLGLVVCHIRPVDQNLSAACQSILKSISLGVPGSLRIDRPDPSAPSSAVVGTWRDKASTLQFGLNGSLEYRIHKLVKSSDLLVAPRRGHYRIERGRITEVWQKSDVWPAEETDCVFHIAGDQLSLLCRGRENQAVYSRVAR